MSAWNEPCPYDGPAHDFAPLVTPKPWSSGRKYAVCRKCGVYR